MWLLMLMVLLVCLKFEKTMELVTMLLLILVDQMIWTFLIQKLL